LSVASSPGRVRMIVHHRFPLDPRVRREARIARNAGYEVEVICLRGEGEPHRDLVEGVKVIRLPVRHVRGRGFLRALIEYLAFGCLAGLVAAWGSLRRRSLDIVHVHTPPDFLVLVGVLPRLLGSRVVIDVHDSSPLMLRERFGARRGGATAVAILRWVERRACAVADRVITVHDPLAREIASDGVPRDKIRVVMNSADETLLAQVPPRASAGGFTVAYHGTVTAWYGVEVLVEAVAGLATELPEARALILGEGDALPDSISLAQRLGVQDRIEFSRRYVPAEDALARVSGASCGVVPNLPSDLNGLTLPTKLLECVALGVPAVVARLDAIAEHFTEDEVTFFEAGNAESLTAALLWVARNPEAARAKADRARERYRSYSWESTRARFLAVLAELQASSRPGPAPGVRTGDPGPEGATVKSRR